MNTAAKNLLNDALIVSALGVAGYLLVKYVFGKALNPFSQGNIANTAVTSAYQDLTGSAGTPGTDLYNLLHPYNPNPSTATYYLRDSNNALVYDSTGTLVQTTIAPGNPGNPIAAGTDPVSLRGNSSYIFS